MSIINFSWNVMSLLSFFSAPSSEYIVVQKKPVIVRGPYSDLQLAKDELSQVALNKKLRMMVEIIDGVIQIDPHYIGGIAQTPANGFDSAWLSESNANAMIEMVKQHMGKNIVSRANGVTLARTHSISELKSRVLKLTQK